MTKKNSQPSSRRHIWVFDDDWKYLEKMFGPASDSRLGVGPTIRQIIHIYVGNLQNKERQIMDARAPASSQVARP